MTQASNEFNQQIINRLKLGEQSAFADLYDAYSPALFGVVSRIVRSEEDAEDVLQDAFVKIWKNIHSYQDSKGSFFTWALNISRNTAIDKLRKNKNKSKSEIQNGDAGVDILNSQNTSINTNLIGLQDEVNKLDPKHKIIVEYLYFKDYTHKELSEELDIPLGTVKTRIRSAMQELRKIYKMLLFWI